ncbi:extracellular solute-binding protein [Burkholderia sp. RS01]|uniref:ABC transporter substrate-binding protein n=1 Tax=unclassified Burkholderia TaxID=2613784 RepID=UPI0032188911
MNGTRRRAKAGFASAISLVAALMVGCTPNEGRQPNPGENEPHVITVWTTETLPDRMAKSRAIVERFTAATGVTVDLVGIPAHRFKQMVASSAASGDLPDVIGSISLGQVRTLAASGLVNADLNASVILALGEHTWSPRALELTREGGKQLSVPDSSWQHLLYYRKDLFAQAGLAAPKTYADIMAAAKKLDTPQMAGFVAANKPGQAFTQQSFEHIAQGNGCEMVNAKNGITFESPQCVAALAFYRDILKNYSGPGLQDIDTVRTAYFSGKAAMAVWPTMMLDELAGLRTDAKPSCPECTSDPGFLARNTGVVAGILGPSGKQPAQFGEITSWTITKDSDADPARRFVEYVMSDGYADWLAIVPEERLPVRAGSPGKPAEFTDAWKTMPVGIGKQEPLGKFYSQDVLAVLLQGAEEVRHWGIIQGQGDLAGAALTELPIAKAVGDVTTGRAEPKAAAQKAAASLRSILGSVK